MVKKINSQNQLDSHIQVGSEKKPQQAVTKKLTHLLKEKPKKKEKPTDHPTAEMEEESPETDENSLLLLDLPEENLNVQTEDQPYDYPIFSSSSHGLTKLDPLTSYMQEIRRYPLLSREEEHRLAVKFSKTRDANIAKQLISSNLRLVVKIAHEYQRAYQGLLDLIQEGNLGLLQAVEKYDPYRGVKLSSYAAWWIRAYMLKFILNNWRLVKIGTTQAQRKLFFNLSKEKESLEASGFIATNELLAKRLAVSEKELNEMQLRLGTGELSLDAPLSKEDSSENRSYMDLLEANADEQPDVKLEGQEFRALLQQKLAIFEKTLKGREKTLFKERLVAEDPLTLQQIGERYRISRERARQIEVQLLSRLKVYLKREMGEAVQIAMGLEG